MKAGLILLIALTCLTNLNGAEFVQTLDYTNQYVEATNGTFTTERICDFQWDTLYHTWDGALVLGWQISQNVNTILIPVVTNGYAFYPMGTERHVYKGFSITDNLISNSPYSVIVQSGITNDILIDWHWDTEYRTEASAINGSTTLANGWYADGTNIQITAIPDPSYTFDHWETEDIVSSSYVNNLSTNMTINISVTNAMKYTARFNLITNYYLGVSASSNGTVSLSHDGFAINSLHPTNYSGDIFAIASNLYEFSHWEGDIDPSETDNNPASIYMNQDRNIVAHFKRSTPIAPVLNITYTAIEWNSELNREYTIQSSTNLLNGDDWTNLTMRVGTGSTMAYTDNRGYSRAFYRLSVY